MRRWPRRRRQPLLSAEEVRERIHAEMARFYDVTPDAVVAARTLWADYEAAGGRYDFSQWLNWAALQMIQELGPPFLTGAELLAKYRSYVRGEGGAS